MERHKLIDKIWDIQTANEDKFMGGNEADLHTREEIADLIEELLLEASAVKNDINTPETHLTKGDVSKSVCDLNIDYQKYLISQGLTHCNQCGRPLKQTGC